MAVSFSRFFVLMTMFIASSWAVDDNQLWLPKKFQHLKPQLLATAVDAESSRRCARVVSGRMLPDKSTADYYYFVITCRDEKLLTYTLGYQYPVAGSKPKRVNEQFLSSETEKTPLSSEAESISVVQAVTLCKNDFGFVTAALDKVSLLPDDAIAVTLLDDGYQVILPFTAQSQLGNRVDYRADCHVTMDGQTQYKLLLQSSGALAICRDHVRSEAILLGRTTLLDDQVQTLAVEQGFGFQIPFEIDSRSGHPVRYSAACRVDAAGDSDISIELQAEGAYSYCMEELGVETLLMKEVAVDDEPLNTQITEQGFAFDMAFDADDPDGNLRKFRAHCVVDKDGRASVVTELDKNAIVSVCISGVKKSAKAMLDVRIREQDIPPLQEDGDGLFSIIPFDARDPSGRLLHFQGECRATDSGKTQVKIKPRTIR